MKDLYANTAARLDTIIGDSTGMWLKVSEAKKEYDAGHNKDSFYTWLQQEYGVKLQFTPDGELTLANEIIDKEKYLMFILKFDR